MLHAIQQSVDELLSHVRAEDYAGYDPFDGLASPLASLFAKRWFLTRLAWIQLCKASPWNMRRLLRVPKGRNPKGIALFVRALLCLAKVGDCARSREEAQQLLQWLLENRVRGFEGYSWGYNFDWQSRRFFAPQRTPNAVCTVFVAQAFLDAFDTWKDPAMLQVAEDSCRFIQTHLIARDAQEPFCRYIPGADLAVHNVNFLAAALLARTAAVGEDKQKLDLARQLVSFSVRRQSSDGAWPYATGNGYHWIDNFHTAFNLVALRQYAAFSQDNSFESALRTGYTFWDTQFLLPDGITKYYSDRVYPIDTHCAAQAILTYLDFRGQDSQALSKTERIASWTLQHLRSPRGYFYYQIRRTHVIRIPYMRWAQAWMLYALSRFLLIRQVEDAHLG